MLAVNKVILAGNLTRDPQLRFITDNKAVADFGIAINHRYKGKDGEMKEEATFVDIEAWGRTAELVGQYLTKGRGCLVEGRLKLDTWEDKDGQKRSKLKVVADGVQFTDLRPKEDAPAKQEAAPRKPVASPADDEPPF